MSWAAKGHRSNTFQEISLEVHRKGKRDEAAAVRSEQGGSASVVTAGLVAVSRSREYPTLSQIKARPSSR